MTKTRRGRPPLPLGAARVPVHFRLPVETLARLDALAEAWGTTRTGAVEMVVEAAPMTDAGRDAGEGENCPRTCGHETFHYCGAVGTHCDKHCVCSCRLCADERTRTVPSISEVSESDPEDA